MENNLSLEGHILSQLNHPGIPRFIDSFSHNSVDYLIQEFMSGYPLSYYIVNGKRFTEEEAKQILFQLLEILVYLHEPEETRRAVIHRDLRLSNVFWFDDKVYLIDFGCACYCNGEAEKPADSLEVDEISIDGRRPGTRTYTLLRKEISPRSDLFGAGVVGLDLFTNWIKDETLLQKPWQEILPASDTFKTLIETLLDQKERPVSAADILKRFRTHDIM